MKYVFALAFSLIGFFSAQAHEGMWMVHMLKQLNQGDMQALGCKLTADDIYNINQSSLKDAIVRLNGGMCTAEMISGKGLVLTNHHCAYDAIQTLSTPEANYLDNGFWAKSFDQELPIPGMYVSFLDRVEDVTEKVLANVTGDMSEDARNGAIAAAIKEIEEKYAAENMEATVKSMYYGNEYYLMLYKNYYDVRLVGAPAESIGKFGGDTDNWMWPRHTGDFSMIRIYANPDNEPAEYAEENVPYRPKAHLKVSLDGVEAGDFTMIMGYPGSTDRFLTSFGVDNAINNFNPTIVSLRDARLKAMKRHMDADPEVRLMYASTYAQVANYWKYFQGQTRGLKRLDVFGQKQALEAKFTKWVNADPARKKEYGDALGMIEGYYKGNVESERARLFLNEAAFASSMMINSYRVFELTQAYDEKAKAFDAGVLEKTKTQVPSMYADYDFETEKDLFKTMFKLYAESLPADNRPDIFEAIDKTYKGNIDAFAEGLFATSVLASPERFEAFLKLPGKKMKKAMDKDIAFQLFPSVRGHYRANHGGGADMAAKKERGYRLFVKGLRELEKDQTFYPDANSTMRLTYGVVGDYFPADAVHYDYVTTANGILEKWDNTNPEFVVPDPLIDLIRKGDYGQYADDNGELVTCFISNNDITGGNSGSPIMNNKGELIGVAFDGNWEAMSGDIAFEPKLQRTISVDIRYVMFVVDKLYGASNIIAEIDFVKKPKAKPQPARAEQEMMEKSAK